MAGCMAECICYAHLLQHLLLTCFSEPHAQQSATSAVLVSCVHIPCSCLCQILAPSQLCLMLKGVCPSLCTSGTFVQNSSRMYPID